MTYEQQQIAAYRLWQEHGCPEGMDDEFWFAAKALSGRCDCDSCRKHRHIVRVILRRDADELIAAVRHLMDVEMQASEDLEYQNSILDGSWPQSVEILERALEKARNGNGNQDRQSPRGTVGTSILNAE